MKESHSFKLQGVSLSTSLTIILSLGFALPCSALMQAKSIRRKPHHPVVTLRIKDSGEATRCTGTHVSKNTILTAAHCFDQLVANCAINPSCTQTKTSGVYNFYPKKQRSLWINKKAIASDFTIMRHRRYRSASANGYTDYDRTNEDVALIILTEHQKNQGYVRVSKQQFRPGFKGWIYGAGMTEVQLYSDPVTGEAYNIEANAGKMKKKKSAILSSARNGLIEVPATLVGRKTKRNLYDLSVVSGLQVLSADSGGPLLRDRILHGIIRNFVFTFTPDRSPASSEPFEIEGRSIFTSLATHSQIAFLKNAERFGGKVNFAE